MSEGGSYGEHAQVLPGALLSPTRTLRRWHFWSLLTHSHWTSQETGPMVPELPAPPGELLTTEPELRPHPLQVQRV